MSLFGALSSGVSGLTAQSSAMGAISDNITNVSTVGYKNTETHFSTLVTKQTSSTFYSAGGVQSRPRQANGVQGLLQATSSQTDIAISGNGYYVVNEVSQPTSTSGAYLFTRAGSFFMDDEGYLRNTSGFYLQGWPTDAGGTVIPANNDLTIANQNVLSNDYLETVNLSRVGGTAANTTTISIGANLPANGDTGDTHKTDVQFFDTLGNATTMSVQYTKNAQQNTWDVTIEPPSGTAVLTQYDDEATPRVYDSIGQLEFGDNVPQDGSAVTVAGVDYIFRDGTNADTTNFPEDSGSELRLDANPSANDYIIVNGEIYEFGSSVQAGANSVAIGANLAATLANLQTAIQTDADYDGTNALLRDTTGSGSNNTIYLGTRLSTGGYSHVVTSFASATATERFTVDISASGITQSTVVDNFISAVQGYDPTFDTTNGRIAESEGSSTTVLFVEDGTGSITVDPSSLVDSSGDPVTTQTSSFTVQKQNIVYSENDQFRFGTAPVDGDTITLNGITYEFDDDSSVTGTNVSVTIDTSNTTAWEDIDDTLSNFVTAVIANDNAYNSTNIYQRDTRGTGFNDTVVIGALSSGSVTITFDDAAGGGFAAVPTDADGTATYTDQTAHTIQSLQALEFDASGLPSTFNTNTVEIIGFSNGASDMDGGSSNADQMTLDFGTIGEANGMTQFGADFTPTFIQQNGSRFGVFSGLTVSQDGLVTALFDNGETRPIFKLPIATFINVNGLEGRTGNVWNSTEFSGDPTLREADSGPAGQTIQASLEQSTVDIGEEFTDMIVVQRAYSAAAKIISTTDEMLEELLRVK